MYLNQNSLQYKNYQDFVKYAQFICEKFAIKIELDATRAETDGKTIYLPNVLTMTEKELDMMYSILLHEAGHIRYSTFSEEYFKSLRSQAHAFLANSIEDGRIENLLMKDFGGAREIFESLYCDYNQDKKLMKKVFKHSGAKPDMFAAIAFYTHNQIVNFQTATLKEICGARMANRIIRFWLEKDLDNVLAQTELKNDTDVINLTNTIYDLFIAHFKAKDKTEKLDYSKEIKKKKALEGRLDSLRKEAEKVEDQVNDLRVKVSEVAVKIENFEKDNEHEIHENLRQSETIRNKNDELREKIDWKNEYESNKKAVAEMPSKIESLKQDFEKQNAEKNRLQEQLEKGVNGRGKELTEDQKEAIKVKIETKKRQEERINQKTASTLNDLENAKKNLVENETSAEKYPEFFDKNMDMEEINHEMNRNQEELKELGSRMQEIEGKKRDLVEEQTKFENQIISVQNHFMEKAAEVMCELDSAGKSSDIDLDILPEMNYTDSWPEAAATQEAFDKKATKDSGKMVRNGSKGAGLFGSNIRDIITFIDKAVEKVEEIDVAEIFKGRIHASKLEDMNSDTKQMNYMEDKSVVGVFGTRREHIPLTTEFDSIKKENHSTDQKGLHELMLENATFYRDIKRLFARKLKFAKKDFWKGAQEEGDLDNRNLWKIPTNQGTDFYEVSNPKFVNKVAATILVDISGSQNKESTEYGKKIRALVLGLSQALDEVHIKHEILGYHAPVCQEMREMQSSVIYTRRSNNLETIVYKEASQRDNSGIMKIEPQMSDNSDGESLRIALKRLKAIRAKSHMVFIISDGKPFLCDTDMSVLDEDFRGALRQAVKDRVQVFGVGFFEQLQLFLGNRFCNASDFNNVLKFFEKSDLK
jgi:myosin heavy subunit